MDMRVLAAVAPFDRTAQRLGAARLDGLHQAIEAKEGVKIEGETQTFATITIQNYFRMYEKLAGMTGTAETEAPEFYKIYKLKVAVIPTNEAVRRVRGGIAEAFARLTDMPLQPGAWTERELNLAAALRDKYAGKAWTRRT